MSKLTFLTVVAAIAGISAVTLSAGAPAWVAIGLIAIAVVYRAADRMVSRIAVERPQDFESRARF
jgi:EamA domain-containing membrane protein RarD